MPEDAELSQTLAEISFRRKEYACAVKLFRGRKRHQRSGHWTRKSLFFLGMALRETGEKPKSRETLEQALAAGLPASLSTEATKALAELGKK